MIEIIPAIDLLDGKAVRLREGLREDSTLYSNNPVELIDRWADAGASRVHVVDLDGAFGGNRVHRSVIEQILARAKVPVQVGGGLRTKDAIEAALSAGASGAVVGTAAIKQAAMVEAACADHPGKIIVAVDARDGMVTTEGWTESSALSAIELAARASSWGAIAVLYTDVARDGTEVGPNFETTTALVSNVQPSIDVIASGGVGTLEHIRRLAATGAKSVIVGRALYEQRFTLGEAIEAGS